MTVGRQRPPPIDRDRAGGPKRPSLPGIAPAGDLLPSWRDSVSKQAVADFVDRVTTEGSPDEVPPEDRIAVFDNDGTLWCEKPMPIQLDFVLRRCPGPARIAR